MKEELARNILQLAKSGTAESLVEIQEICRGYIPREPLSSKDVYEDVDLRYSATARCKECGAGLAYPPDHVDFRNGAHQEWACSRELKGELIPLEAHARYPFAFYEIKSEHQPSACGQTTRPK